MKSSHTLIRGAGAIFMYHGYGKLFRGFAPVVAKDVLAPMGLPIPEVLAYKLGLLQFLGGAALAVGFLTRPRPRAVACC